ncbi:chromosome partition protein Smc [Jeongeupia sp. HS-3]|uniref:chromosome segregation protein SMC n=1 Tax=Jeongeupia sp. HS-3 TaxID=1009682 RepID=UPI0018A5C343|nr:chromosome segregation protein SMC [Jeongeupia sp. HS-3]BCL75366.1 chromosome partition protein Smc [Jeongeupia sp. HS-3]
MRLRHIKLAGFKSFVDPTTIHVPGQLVAVCGPNGCGKSNVIDAVRWVLGESSAKQLRGESMQDVIFNGSTSRKPVSRASVELVFDNSAGLAAGPWQQYAEISIKRVLTRQGDSNYYINNLAVRRRDITDLFLGTGVGKGGYAIIEQGMISRIIEAKPEELRHFLEEAAGVSKYKERRRETESRLADTRDNLARLDDIRQELLVQVDKLQAQAEVATEYQRLQAAITEKQNLLALRRKRDAAGDLDTARGRIAAAQNALEAQLAALRSHEAEIESLREHQLGATDQVQLAQAGLFEANAAVARLEQQLLHLRQTRERLQQQAGVTRDELAKVEQQARTAEQDGVDWQRKRDEAGLAVEEAALAFDDECQRQPELDAALGQQDQALQQARERFAIAHTAAQLAQQQSQQQDQAVAALAARRAKLASDLALPAQDDDLAALHAGIETLRASIDDSALAVEIQEDALDAEREQFSVLRIERERLALAQTDAAARCAAFAAEPAGDETALTQWLTQAGLSDVPTLLAQLDVEPDWATALEAVLGDALKGRIAADIPSQIAPASAVLLHGGALSTPLGAPAGWMPLLARISVRDADVVGVVGALLATVYCADSLEDAVQARHTLPGGGRFVTRDGHIVDAIAVRYHAASGEAGGLIRRQQAKELAEAALSELTPRLLAAQADSELLQRTVADREMTLKSLRQQHVAAQPRLLAMVNELSKREAAAIEVRLRREASSAALADIDQQYAEAVLAQQLAAAGLERAEASLPPLLAIVEAAQLARADADAAAVAQRDRLRMAEQAAQAARFAAQTAHDRLADLAHRGDALIEQAEVLRERLASQLIEFDGIDEAALDGDVQQAVELRGEKERLLAGSRDALNGIAQALRERETDKQAIEGALDPAREALSALKLREQEARLAFERFAAELAEAGADETVLLDKLGDGVKTPSLINEMSRLSQALNALGPVNLAALAELQGAQERAGYLASQSNDLAAAIETLEGAIRRIDRETRSLLQETYDAVNANLQELFPALFGGGHAELLLTGDEILDAGLQIMAQPPGKKNSTIHLLSGGEKALTALSLVFSLFRLNPAPFCLLDEVDAPLDDANTLRFCGLVKKMAERTQFLYISHNRLTMEMAEQLIGVTMQEQGVSRVVAVDIQQALTMRDSALAV